MKRNLNHHDDKSKYRSKRLPMWQQLPILAALWASSLAAAGKVSNDLQGVAQGSTVNVIVQFTQPPSAADVAAIVQLGGTVSKGFQHVPSLLISVPASALQGIANNPRV